MKEACYGFPSIKEDTRALHCAAAEAAQWTLREYIKTS